MAGFDCCEKLECLEKKLLQLAELVNNIPGITGFVSLSLNGTVLNITYTDQSNNTSTASIDLSAIFPYHHFAPDIVVDYYSNLPSSGHKLFEFALVENSSGSQWQPGSNGGNYYGAGLYYWNGSQWVNIHDDVFTALQDIYDTLQQIQTDLTNLETYTINNINSINAQINSIQQDINNIQNNINTINTNIANIQSDIINIKADIQQIQNDISIINTQIATLQNTVQQIQNDISQMQQDISQIQIDIANINGQIAVINSTISQIQQDISQMQADIQQLQQDVQNIQQDISQMQSDIQQLQQDVQSIQQDIQNIQQDIQAINYDINQIKTDLSNLQQQVSQNTNDIQILQNDVQNINNIINQIQQDIQNINNTIAQIQQDIQNINNAIAQIQQDIIDLQNNKADKSITITGVDSITGGGDLSANRTLRLVNDVSNPGPYMYYGTDIFGQKGWVELRKFYDDIYHFIPDIVANNYTELSNTYTPAHNNFEVALVLNYEGTIGTASWKPQGLYFWDGSSWIPVSQDAISSINTLFSSKADKIIQIIANKSLSGGGDLSSNVSLELDGDVDNPGPFTYYGTDNSGVKGWQENSPSFMRYFGDVLVNPAGVWLSPSMNANDSEVVDNGSGSINYKKVFESNHVLPIKPSKPLRINKIILFFNNMWLETALNIPNGSRIYDVEVFMIKDNVISQQPNYGYVLSPSALVDVIDSRTLAYIPTSGPYGFTDRVMYEIIPNYDLTPGLDYFFGIAIKPSSNHFYHTFTINAILNII